MGHCAKYVALILLAGLATFSSSLFCQELEIPNLTKRVTDLTGTLTPSELHSLEQELNSFERSTSTQVVVFMLNTLGQESIEDYSIRLVEFNQIGQKNKDNGVLLLIAKDDRLMRIEVGYGLEGALPDALGGIIIRREIVPLFKQNDYYGGIQTGVRAIMKATQNEYQADADHTSPATGITPLLLFLFLVFFALRGMFRGRRHIRRSRFGQWYPFGGLSRHGGNWGSGGWSSGGGFSGGGGMFGGGGATGRW